MEALKSPFFLPLAPSKTQTLKRRPPLPDPPESYKVGGELDGQDQDLLQKVPPPEQFEVPSPTWAIAQTLSRQEKCLARFLVQQQIPYYLPYTQHISSSRNRFLVPLFPGILFFRFSRHSELDLIHDESRCIFSFLFTADQSRLKSELALLMSETPQARTLRVHPSMPRGQQVLVVSGPMQGMQGRIIDRSHNNKSSSSSDPAKSRFAVELVLLGRIVSVELPAEVLEELA